MSFGRPRDSPNGSTGSPRRPPGAPSGPPSTTGSTTLSGGLTRAERFEDERRRITESCFAKVDTNGQLNESYITHIRVQEDAASPQLPAPPNSNPASKKVRVIIISVRSSGRVRLHKGRENANGTFSIGKTWNMEDLTAIENWVHLVPKNEEEAQRKRWAGDVGFTVTIAKPYYWEAGTPKEKEFFIASLIKIYHKYTQGKFPILSGFDAKEKETLMSPQPSPQLNQQRSRPPPSRPGQSPGMLPPHSPALPGEDSRSPSFGDERRPPPLRDERRPQPVGDDRRPPPLGDRRPPPLGADRRPPPLDDRRPLGNRPLTGDDERIPLRRPPTSEGDRRPPPLRGPLGPNRPPTGEDDRRPPPLRSPLSQGQFGPQSPMPPYMTGPDGERRPRPRPSMEQGLRSQPSRERMDMRSPPSREQMRPMPGMQVPTPPLPQGLTPQSSRSQIIPQRSKTPESTSSFGANSSPRRQPRQADDARSQKSMDEPTSDGAALGISTSTDQRRPNGFPSTNGRDLSPKGLRPGTAQSNASSALSRNDDSVQEDRPPRAAPPERRRPPMLAAQSQQSQRSFGSDSNSEFFTPQPTPPPGTFPGSLMAGRRPDGPRERQKSAMSEAPQNISSQIEPEPLLPSQSVVTPQTSQPPTSPLPAIPKITDSKPASFQAEDKIGETPPASDEAAATAPEQEDERPGLGPMIKKKPKELADTVRKAAKAYGAFKPRVGGAADKLFSKDTKKTDEPDGIRGVVPAPSRVVGSSEPEKKPEPDRSSRDLPKVDTDVVPSFNILSPLSPPASTPAAEPEQKSLSPEPEKQVPVTETEARKKRRRSNQQIQNISKLGIEPSLLDGRGLEFELLLSDFGWGSSELSPRNLETLECDIKREIARVEAGSWLTHLEQKDDRVEAVEKLLDRAIAECDELEGLLTLYNVELSSLNDDIAFIEAQGQGLQVQTANQKLLQSELQQLVDTISITSSQLEPLRRAPIGKVSGLKAIESALVMLYKALTTIDPAIVQGSRASTTDGALSTFGNSELAAMQALQEKRDLYLEESTMFLSRLVQFMDMTYGAAFMDTKDALAKLDPTAKPWTKRNVDAHDLARKALWQFSPLLLFAKEVDNSSWETLVKMYQTRAATIYQDEIRDNITSWKRFARKATGEEADLLFTSQEKESESLTGAARKLTIKRSQTLARGLRAASGDKDKDKEKEKESKADRTQSGKYHPFEVFAGVLDDSGPLLLTEQNFITDFFHATSSDTTDFADAVKAAAPEDRQPPSLLYRRPFESDRIMAKRVASIMEDIFTSWPNDIQNLVEWAVKADPLQGVGILCAVDRKLVEIEDSNQDFLTRSLQKIHERLTGLFTRFVDEQIRAIEDTKVKIKKRKGVITFIKTFPHFSISIENMLPAADESERLEIRSMVDDAYQKINKAMFESLKVIAKESPAVMASHSQSDPEDKEALNYHILLIENMNHFVEEVDDRGDGVLSDWSAKAREEMVEHLGLYVDAVIRRPLGKLLEFLESTESLLAQPGMTPSALATRSSHSRTVFRKLCAQHDGKELRKGVEALKKRVDKHFGDADDPSLSRNLVAKVLKECEVYYVGVAERAGRVAQDLYGGEVEMDWGGRDVGGWFRR